MVAVRVTEHCETRREPFELLSDQVVSLGLRATAAIVCYAWVVFWLLEQRSYSKTVASKRPRRWPQRWASKVAPLSSSIFFLSPLRLVMGVKVNLR